MECKDEKFMRSVQLMRSFAGIQKNMIRFVQKSAAENGLSIPQYTILMTLAVSTEMTQKNIGEKTFLPKSTLSQSVDGLVREGLINRQQVEGNRREMLLSLSDTGLDRIKAIHMQEGGIHQVFQEVTDSLSSEQYDGLIETHHQIKTQLENIEQEEQQRC